MKPSELGSSEEPNRLMELGRLNSAEEKLRAVGRRLSGVSSDDKSVIESNPRDKVVLENVIIKGRFESEKQVLDYYNAGLDQINRTAAGEQFVGYVDQKKINIRSLIEESREGDLLTRVAYLAKEAALDPIAVGNLVHRFSELHTLYKHPGDVVRGIRMTEQNIFFSKNGAHHRVELDTVIQRGNIHHIRDNKPINLKEFIDKRPDGSKWDFWMRANFGQEYQEQIQSGVLNPFVSNGWGGALPLDHSIRDALRRFMTDKVSKYKNDLDIYKKAYINAQGLKPEQVQIHVRPYFVIR